MRNYGAISEERLAEVLFMAFHDKVDENACFHGWDAEGDDRVVDEFRKYAKMVVDELDMSEIGTIYRKRNDDDTDVECSGHIISFQVVPDCGVCPPYNVSIEVLD